MKKVFIYAVLLFLVSLTTQAKDAVKGAQLKIECGLSHHAYLDFLELNGKVLVTTYGVADEKEDPAHYYSVVSTSQITIQDIKNSIKNNETLSFSMLRINTKTGNAIIGQAPLLVQIHTFYPGGSFTSSISGLDKFSRCGFDGEGYDL